MENATPSAMEHATFGGGCFWCLEALFAMVPGVLRVTSGYAGGQTAHPGYEAVCSGATGHAEVVRVAFDPGRVTYRELVDLFWEVHDPTTPDRQGADVGTQYRSVILFETPAQEADARASMEAARARFGSPVVTQIAPLDRFWPAEAYHDDFYARNPQHPYCRAVIAPKLARFRSRLP